jgi:hypothetical protein
VPQEGHPADGRRRLLLTDLHPLHHAPYRYVPDASTVNAPEVQRLLGDPANAEDMRALAALMF